MTRAHERDGATAMTAHERFLEIVCADQELVQGEFDAIIAAQQLEAPPPGPGCAADLTRTPQPSGRHRAASGATPRERPLSSTTGGRSRERSPPR